MLARRKRAFKRAQVRVKRVSNAGRNKRKRESPFPGRSSSKGPLSLAAAAAACCLAGCASLSLSVFAFDTRLSRLLLPGVARRTAAEALELETPYAPRSTRGQTRGRQGSSRRVGAAERRHRGGERMEDARERSTELCLSLSPQWDPCARFLLPSAVC